MSQNVWFGLTKSHHWPVSLKTGAALHVVLIRCGDQDKPSRDRCHHGCARHLWCSDVRWSRRGRWITRPWPTNALISKDALVLLLELINSQAARIKHRRCAASDSWFPFLWVMFSDNLLFGRFYWRVLRYINQLLLQIWKQLWTLLKCHE